MRKIDASVQRKSGVVLSYVDMAMQIVISLVYTPVMLNLLGQSEYGLYSLASSTISYLSLITLGVGGAYVRFYMKSKVAGDENGIRELNGMYLLFYGIAALVALLAGFAIVSNSGSIFTALTSDEVAITEVLLALLIVNLAISFPASIFSSYITVNERFILQRVLMIVRHMTSPLLVLPVLLMGYGSVGYVLATVAVNIAFEFFNVFYAIGKLKMRFSFKNLKFSLFWEVAVFSFFLLLNQIIDQVNSNVGNLLLGMYQGSAAVAVYGVARQITNYFFSFSTAVSSVYTPQINNMVASGASGKDLTELFTRIGRIQFIIMALVLSGLIFFGHPFVSLWAGDDYADAYHIILLLCCPVVVPLIQNAGLAIQQAMNRHQVRSIAYLVMAVFNVAISIPLIQKYSYMGAAVGTCLSYIFCNIIFMNIYYHKGLGLDMIHFWKEIARFIPSLIAPVGFGLLLKVMDVNLYSWRSLFGYIILYCIVYALSMYFIGLNRSEKALADRILFHLHLKRRRNKGKVENSTSANSPTVSFRVKSSQGGWRNYSVQYTVGKKTLVIPHTEDEFMRAFLSGYILRPSCYNCQFKGDGYKSDLTLGDFWGIDSVLPSFSDNKGVSEVVARTPKGLSVLDSLSSLEKIEVSREAAYQSAMEHSVRVPEGRELYFSSMGTSSLADLNRQSIKRRKTPLSKRIVFGLGRRILGRYVHRTPDNRFRKGMDAFLVDTRVHDSFQIRESCTGCGACVAACGRKAITIVRDSEGFSYPEIDTALCVECGLCQRVCPVKKENLAFHARYSAAKNKNEDERLASSSGGVFILLAKETIERGGLVFGAAFDDNLAVHHQAADNLEDVRKFMVSKYVQSDMGSTYIEAERGLKEGREVLFSGTPCQIAGLRSYLGKDYSNLLAVDVLCHGAPSPAVFIKYLQDMEILTGGGYREREVQRQAVRLARILHAPFSETVVILYISISSMVRPEDMDANTFLASGNEFAFADDYREAC